MSGRLTISGIEFGASGRVVHANANRPGVVRANDTSILLDPYIDLVVVVVVL